MAKQEGERYQFPPASKMLGGPTRNIALWQDRLFLATYDAAIVAIDATTGIELWRTEKADYRKAFTHSAGPIVANGVVVSGMAVRGRRFPGSYILLFPPKRDLTRTRERETDRDRVTQ